MSSSAPVICLNPGLLTPSIIPGELLGGGEQLSPPLTGQQVIVAGASLAFKASRQDICTALALQRRSRRVNLLPSVL